MLRFDRAVPALEELGTHTAVQVLLREVVVPGSMDSAQLALEVMRRFPAVRILLMTGYAEQIDAIQALGFEVLPKPCSAPMLAEALARAPTGGAHLR